MNKLNNLKSFHTLKQAATLLSAFTKIEISEADILHYALEGHTTLSVKFICQAPGLRWELVSIENAETCEVDFFTSSPYIGIQINDSQVLEKRHSHEDSPESMTGVYDILMWGSGKLVAERAYQSVTDFKNVTMHEFYGIFLRSDSGEIYELKEHYEYNEQTKGSRASLIKIKSIISQTHVSEDRATEMLENWELYSRQLQQSMSDKPTYQRFYSAKSLPVESFLVIRSSALDKLEKNLISKETIEKPLTEKEKTSVSLMIAAMADMAGLDIFKPNKAATDLIAHADSISLKALSPGTLSKFFNLAQEHLAERNSQQLSDAKKPIFRPKS